MVVAAGGTGLAGGPSTGGLGVANTGAPPASPVVVAGATAVAGDAASVVKGTVGVDGVRLADAAKCEVYVCFEGPLGAHLI